MASLEDIFGGGDGDAKPKYADLKQPGDKVVGVIVGEPDLKVPVRDFKTKKNKYFVKTGVGQSGWQVVLDGDFDPEKFEHRPVTKIVVTLQTADGKQYRIDFNTKQEREALKQAMIETGLPLEEGVTIGKQVTARDGNNKTVAVKLAQ